jgi:outer membrane protein assembly factor BamB
MDFGVSTRPYKSCLQTGWSRFGIVLRLGVTAKTDEHRPSRRSNRLNQRAKFNLFTSAALGLLFWVWPVAAENWPQFRGPRGDGTSLATNPPVQWSTTRNVRWKTPIPGEGHSSPIVWNDSVFVTTALEDGRRILVHLDARSGKVVWQRAVAASPKESMHRENSSASSTPATDGQYVFTSFQAGNRVDLRCFDLAGKEIWAKQPLRFDGQHGYSYSPILYEDLLLFDCRQEGEAAVLGIEKQTGQIRWRAEPGRRRISHVTPLVVNDGSGPQLIVSGSDETRSYHPLTRAEIWRCDGPSDVAVSGLAYGDGMVFASAGYPVRSRIAVRIAGRGDVTQSHVAWSFRRQAPYVPSPVFFQGHLYAVLDEGMLTCFNAHTGEPTWQQRLGGRFRSSLVLAAGRLYATNDGGTTTVFEANPAAFRLLATNDLQEFCYATPALSGGRMFIRTGGHLFCLE